MDEEIVLQRDVAFPGKKKKRKLEFMDVNLISSQKGYIKNLKADAITAAQGTVTVLGNPIAGDLLKFVSPSPLTLEKSSAFIDLSNRLTAPTVVATSIGRWTSPNTVVWTRPLPALAPTANTIIRSNAANTELEFTNDYVKAAAPANPGKVPVFASFENPKLITDSPFTVTEGASAEFSTPGNMLILTEAGTLAVMGNSDTDVTSVLGNVTITAGNASGKALTLRSAATGTNPRITLQPMSAGGHVAIAPNPEAGKGRITIGHVPSVSNNASYFGHNFYHDSSTSFVRDRSDKRWWRYLWDNNSTADYTSYQSGTSSTGADVTEHFRVEPSVYNGLILPNGAKVSTGKDITFTPQITPVTSSSGVMNYFESCNFDLTASGGYVGTVNCLAQRIGKWCTLQIKKFSGTTANTANPIILASLPGGLRPLSIVGPDGIVFYCRAKNAGAYNPAFGAVKPDGTIDIYANETGGLFTAASDNGIELTTTVSYQCAV